MDPATAIGFAASIISFIDFSHKIITGTLEVLKNGSTSENAHISVILNDFRSAAKPLCQPPTGQSEHEEALRALAIECEELSRDLADFLNKLKTTPDGSLWGSMRVALRSMRKKGKVAEIEARLDKYRAQLLLRLNLLLSERQVSTELQLSAFRAQVQKHSIDVLAQLTELRDEVLRSVETGINHACSLLSLDLNSNDANGDPNLAMQPARQEELIRDLRRSIDAVLEQTKGPSPEMRVLQQLYFSSMYDREDSVAAAEDQTFEWILDVDSGNTDGDGNESHADSDINNNNTESAQGSSLKAKVAKRFTEWLRSENGVFHISGKAGCGKSTLMKLVFDDPRTKRELGVWAGNNKLVMAHFFFWRSGLEIQRSMEGLYRSILFETLIQCPELIPAVFPKAYKAFSRTAVQESIDQLFFHKRDFGNALQALVSQPLRRHVRFCFFVDGLDEFGGDDSDPLEHQILAKHLKTWSCQEGIKVLASSRPHRQFENTFSDLSRLRLHELNRSDIIAFSRRMFEKDDSFERPEIRQCYHELVDEVAKTSEGVFLWARLAVRSLLNSIGRYDPVSSLRKRLQAIPKEINELYEALLASIDPVDKERAFKLLLLVARWPFHSLPIPAIVVAWLDDLDDPNFPLTTNPKPYTEEETNQRLLEIRHQLDSLTKGLLEVTVFHVVSPNAYWGNRVQFLHRTVRDFVLQSEPTQGSSSKLASSNCVENSARLYLAACSFTEPGLMGSSFGGLPRLIVEITRDVIDSLTSLPETEQRYNIIDAFSRMIDHHNSIKPGRILGLQIWGLNYFESSHSQPGLHNSPFRNRVALSPCVIPGTSNNLSLFHFLTLYARAASPSASAHLQKRLSSHPEIRNTYKNKSLLLSSLLNGQAKIVEMLLHSGASAQDCLRSIRGVEKEYTVWQLFFVFVSLDFLAMMRYSSEPWVINVFEMLQLLLEAGVDPNCTATFFLHIRPSFQDASSPYYNKINSTSEEISLESTEEQLGDQSGSDPSRKPSATHYLSLEDMVRQVNPPNTQELISLINRRRGWLGIALGMFSPTYPSGGSSLLKPLRMIDSAAVGGGERLHLKLHSVTCGEIEIDHRDIEILVC